MRELYKRIAPHIDRVRLDGGVVDNINDLFLLQKSNEELKDYIKVSFCPELYGVKIRQSGGTNFITKGYSKDNGENNDLVQVSSANQPFLDKIASSEKLSAKNPNGGSNYLTHPIVSFSANNEWTVEITLNANFNSITNLYIIPQVTAYYFGFIIRSGTTFQVAFNIGVGGSTYVIWTNINTSRFAGKTKNFTLVKTPNHLELFIDGISYGKKDWVQSGSFGRLFTNEFDGTILSYHIFSKALSASEVAERSSILRSIFPEIPFTRIGDQIWSVRNFEAVVTPMGNVIPEIQANANVEKITNVADREFSSDTGFWSKDNTVNISNGTLNFVNSNSGNAAFNFNFLTKNKWYKITYTISSLISGSFKINLGNLGASIVHNSLGTYTIYAIALDESLLIRAATNNTTGSIDNISIQEIGHSSSQELYDGVYAQTSGTVEQKTYAALKAAAMWSHYNNDTTTGATYGKLYNGFARKLIYMDIVYYNAANPNNKWGWNVPLKSEVDTLISNLGGVSVAGGKLKETGNARWTNNNVGASNESFMSFIPTGVRNIDGNFSSIGESTSITFYEDTIQPYVMLNNTPTITLGSQSNIVGRPIRLIKNS